MTDQVFSIEIEGLDELLKAFDQFPREVNKAMQDAAIDAYKAQVLSVTGLQKYPPATAANRPPFPYYLRGSGTQTSAGRNTGTSKNLGKQWVTKRVTFGAKLSNAVPYARFVHGVQQPQHMRAKGWRKLTEVVEFKLPQITKVFQNHVDRLLTRLKLK
jgi:hypothetical protein